MVPSSYINMHPVSTESFAATKEHIMSTEGVHFPHVSLKHMAFDSPSKLSHKTRG